MGISFYDIDLNPMQPVSPGRVLYPILNKKIRAVGGLHVAVLFTGFFSIITKSHLTFVCFAFVCIAKFV